MSTSNYPNGFSEGLLVRGVPIAPLHGAKIFYVGNNSTLLTGEKTASNGNKGNFLDPFSTIAYAVTQCVTNRGDIIVVRDGHALTLTGTSDIDINKNNISIVGLGKGAKRPTVTIGTAATATLTISGAGVSLENFLAVSALDGLNTALTVTGADVYLDIEHRDTSATVEADIAVTVSGVRPFIKLRDIGFTAGDQREASISANAANGGRFEVDFYGKALTSVVNFVTTLSSDVLVTGYMYNSGTTDGTKNVVDTITGSLWYMDVVDGAAGARYTGGSAATVASDDVSAIAALLVAPTADVTTTTNLRDSVGIKTDAAVTAVGTTKSVMAYSKGLVTMATVQSADSANNAFAGDVVGNKTDAAIYVPGTTKSLAAYAKGMANLQENVVATAAAVIAAGTATIFTIAGGPIEVVELLSVCVTANDATATLLKYTADPTNGAATDLTIASASLTSAAAGTTTLVTGTFASAPTISANGTVAGGTTKFIVPAGVIQSITTGGVTTGTWTHHLRYKPLAKDVTVV